MAVTTRTDYSADLVVQRCEARGVQIYRFNSEDYPQRIGLEIDPIHPEESVLLTDDGHRVAIGRARGVWLRRPQWPVISSLVTDQLDRQLAAQESVAAAAGLWRLLSGICVSPPNALQAARWKLPQLRLASRLGFAVPETILTTDRHHAKRFLESGPAVIKAVQDAHVRIGTRVMTGMTERVDVDDLVGVDLAPVLLQREIAKVADYRVTVVGDRLFAAKTTRASDAPVDVRASKPENCSIELATLDRDFQAACFSFVAASGLRYGAFDFAEDGAGTLWFLECNPNGQWGWIESASGAPITDAIVDLLLNPGGDPGHTPSRAQ